VRAVKVVVCFHEPHLGGATRSVERIVPLLSERGWDFSFWVPKPSVLHDELASRGWDVDGAPRSVEYSVRAWRLDPGPRERISHTPAYVRRYRAFLADRRPQLVHANSILTLAEALIARRDGIPTVLHAHEMLPLDPRGWMLRRVAWRQLDAVVAVSRPCAARLAWDGRHPQIVYEGAPVPERQAELRAEPRPFTVGTVAVVSTRKGSDLFVEAARLLAARNGGDAYRFEMVGGAHDAIERDWARNLLESARETGITHIPHTDVFERMRAWDAFVLPSRADPFPLSMLEAMATGLPVIGTRTDGIAEQIVPGTGMLIEPESPRALADAIAWCAAQPLATRERMGSAARARVAANFTLEHQATAIDHVYRRTLAEAAKAGEPEPALG
jgi:glycosyltransferase involved in cell wall biosynthesis